MPIPSIDVDEIKDYPIDLIKHNIFIGRRLFFRIDKPDGLYLIVKMKEGDIKRILGNNHFQPDWKLSYYSSGEDINMARPYYNDSTDHDIEWWQVHVRGWESNNIIKLSAHVEAHPLQHWREHLNGVGKDKDVGNEIIEQILTDQGIEVGYTWKN